MPKVIFFTNLVSELAQQVIAPAPQEVGRIGPTTRSTSARESQPGVRRRLPDTISQQSRRGSAAVGARAEACSACQRGFRSHAVSPVERVGDTACQQRGTNSIDVAEHTFALILSVYRRLTEMDRNVRNDGWKDIDSGMTTYTIHGKTVGIVGLGHIGREVAKRLVPFEAQVLYFDPFPADAEVERNLQVERVSLHELLDRSDIVSLHVPLNDQTRHLIGQAELERMKSSAILVNTCRGPVVDEEALIEVLRSGGIRAAGLDVLRDEPTDPGNPILQLDNVIFSPHIAGVTYDTWQRRGRFIFDNLQRVWAGEEPLSRVGL